MIDLFRKKISMSDYEYLLHHIEANDNGDEEIHHCYIADHLGNLFEHGHLVVRDGKIFINGKKAGDGVYHVIVGLEGKQDVSWSDKEAKEHGIKPKKLRSGMSFKKKAKEW